MNTDPADIDLIEKYIQGKLTPGEAMDFEFRLADDHEFARKYRLRKTFPEMRHEDGNDGTEKEPGEPPDKSAEKRSPDFLKSRYLAWGTIVVIITGALMWWINMKTDQADKKLVSKGQVILNDSQNVSQGKQPGKIVNRTIIQPMVKKPISLEVPADGETLFRTGDILFRWQLETDTFTNLYIYSDVDEQLVWWRGIKPGVREHKVPAIYFQPGKFHWYVGTKDVKRTFVISE